MPGNGAGSNETLTIKGVLETTVTVFAVALLTVGVQALRAATADPVKSLRYD